MPVENQENGTATIPETKNGRLEPNLDNGPDVDSTEIDPLNHEEDSKQKKLPFHEKYISNLQAETGLSRKWVFVVLALALVILVLLLTIVGFAIGWPTVPHMYRHPICRDQGCLRAASQVQENLDSSVSPCTDLWASVCSKYAKNSTRPVDRPVWNQKQKLVQKEYERLRDVISTLDLPLHMGTVEWKLKHFYEACLYVDTISIDADRPLTNIISELGGWYILREWGEVDFDGMQVLTKLQVGYGVSSFFKIHVEPDPHVPDKYSIRISPSGLGLPDKEYYNRDSDDRILTAYQEYIRDIVISLGATRNEAAKFAKDIFHYEERIAEITPDLVSLQNPITTYNAISLSELKSTTTTIPFFEILQAMYPKVVISENTEIIVTSLEYLNQLAQIISSTDRKTMNGYLMWTLVRDYIPFLSQKNTALDLNSFNNELFGTSKLQKRWEVCSGLVRKHMDLASEYHLEKTYPIAENTRHLLNDTFKSILNVVKRKLTKFDETALLRQHLEVKLDTLSLHVGLPDTIKTPLFLKDYYSTLRIIKLNFFEGMKSAVAFRKTREENMLMSAPPEGEFLRQTLREVPVVRYIPSKRAVVIPRSLVMEPFFENSYPNPILYGRLGVEIASAIVSSVLPYGSLWTADKKILSPFHMTVNESVKSVQPSMDCLWNNILDLNSNAQTSRASETSLTVLTQLLAVQIAYEALYASSDLDNHVHYGGLEQYEEPELYFLGFAQTQCSDSTKQYEIFENLLHFKLPSKSVLDLAWEQLPDFRKAFDCAPSKTTRCKDVF